MKRSIRKKNFGFTLLELMTAMAITSVLVLVIVGVTSVSINIFQNSRQDVIAARSSRPAILTLSSDLESMHYRPGNNFEWLYAGRDPNLNLSALSNMKLGPSERKAANAVRLMFFSSAPDSSSAMDSFGNELNTVARRAGGDVNMISYRLVYKDHILNQDASKDSLGYPVFSLYRNVVPANATFSGGQGGGALLGQTNLLQAYSSREEEESSTENFLAENIVEFTLAFEVEYTSRGGSGSGSGASKSIKIIPILSSGVGTKVGDARDFRVRGNGLVIEGGDGITSDVKAGRLAAVHICMTVLTEEGMARVDLLRQGQRLPNERDFFAKYSRNFTARIPISRP